MRFTQKCTSKQGIKIVVVGLTLLLGWATGVWGQSFLGDSYQEEDGLSSSFTYSMMQEPGGSMLVATKTGVNRFDGKTWTAFPNTLYLPNSSNSRFLKSPSGQVFLFGFNYRDPKVFQYQNQQWKALRAPMIHQHESKRVLGFDIQERNSNSFSLVMGFQQEVHQYSSELEEWRSLQLPFLQSKNHFIQDVQFHKGHLHVLTNQGMWIQEPNNQWIRVFENAPNQNFVRMGQHPTTRQVFYLGAGWVAEAQQDSLKVLVNDFQHQNLHFIQHASLNFTLNQEVLFGVNSPIHRYSITDGTLQAIDLSRQIPLLYHNNLYLDREKDLWISTDRGMMRLRDRRISYLSVEHGLPESEVSGLHLLPDSSMLIGSNFFLGRYKDGAFESIFQASNTDQINYRFMSMETGPHGSVWLTSRERGVGKWDEENGFEWVTDYPEGNYTTNALKWWNDSLLVSMGSKISYWNADHFEPYFKCNSFIRRMVDLKSGQLYVVTNDGITRLHNLGKPLQHFAGSDGRQKAYDLLEYRNEKLVATDAGLCRLHNNEIEFYPLGDTIIQRSIYELTLDNKGGLWMGTDRGLLYYHPRTGWEHFHKSHGLLGNDINRFTILELPDGSITAGSENGISIFDARNLSPNIDKAPQPHFYGIEVNGNQPIDWAKPVELEPNQNSLEVRFGTISYSAKSTYQYRFRLLGSDSTWMYHKGASHQSHTFLSLWGGRYQFEFQVRDLKGAWSSPLRSSTIEITHPFYRQWWFLSLLLVVFIGLGSLTNRILYFRRRESKLQKRVQQSTEIIRQSEAELRLQNEQLTKANMELDRFVYQVAHDLRGPLMRMKGMVELHRLDPDMIQELLPMVNESVEQMDHFITEIIDFAKNHRKEVEGVSIDFQDLVEDVVSNAKNNIDTSSIELQMEVQQDHEFVSDPLRIHAILNNLISNATQYYDAAKSNPYAKIIIKTDPTQASIKVEDNGMGIDSDQQQAVFDMFYRGSRNSTGSGLGLYIVKEIVNRLGGIVDLSSHLGHGTVVEVKLRNRQRLKEE